MSPDPVIPPVATESAFQKPIGLLGMAAVQMLLLPIGFLIRWGFAVHEGSERYLGWRGDLDGQGVLWGIVVGACLYGGYLLTELSSWSALVRIRNFLLQNLGEVLRRCSWWHFVLVGTAAGISEEYLFRGVLEPRLGFLVSNLIFALLHPHSLLYVVLAYAIGGVMSVSLDLSGSLWTPVAAHAIYDIAVLQRLARNCRSEQIRRE